MFGGFTNKTSIIRKVTASAVILAFGLSVISPAAYAQQAVVPGAFSSVSAVLTPVPVLKGLKLHPQNPLKFDFIIDQGKNKSSEFKTEANKIIKYFLAALTTPEEDLWVNLNPKEPDRIVPPSFGKTEMGRDMLAQDYILKQITASLMHPDIETGKELWNKIYKKAFDVYGTTDISTDILNKVWIVPEKAVVYEAGDRAFVTEAKLKVLLEDDRLQQAKNNQLKTKGRTSDDKKFMVYGLRSIVQSVIIPAIEEEVNHGESFAKLRQVYHSLILAAWYKRNLKESLLGRKYIDQNKTSGVEIEDKDEKLKIYEQYLKTFKDGAYNYIKEEYDPVTRSLIPRKYFCGGNDFAMIGKILKTFNKKSNPGRARIFAKALAVTAALTLVPVMFSTVNAQKKSSTDTTAVVSLENQAYWMKMAREDAREAWKKRNKFMDESWSMDVMRTIAENIGFFSYALFSHASELIKSYGEEQAFYLLKISTENDATSAAYDISKLIKLFGEDRAFELLRIMARNGSGKILDKMLGINKAFGEERAFALAKILAVTNAGEVAYKLAFSKRLEKFGKEKEAELLKIASENDPEEVFSMRRRFAKVFNLPDDFFSKLLEDYPDLFMSARNVVWGEYLLLLKDTPFKQTVDEETAQLNLSEEEKTSLAIVSIRLCNMLNISFKNQEHFRTAARFILDLRKIANEKPLLGEDSFVINLADREMGKFNINKMEEFENSAGVLKENIRSFKEGKNSLGEVIEAVENAKGRVVFFYSGHGLKGELSAMEGITFRQLGDALSSNENIESIRMLNFSCFSYDFNVALENYLIGKEDFRMKLMASSAGKDASAYGFIDFLDVIQAQRERNGRANEPFYFRDLVEAEVPNIFYRQDPAAFYNMSPGKFKRLVEKDFGNILPAETLQKVFGKNEPFPVVPVEIMGLDGFANGNKTLQILLLLNLFSMLPGVMKTSLQIKKKDAELSDQAMISFKPLKGAMIPLLAMMMFAACEPDFMPDPETQKTTEEQYQDPDEYVYRGATGPAPTTVEAGMVMGFYKDAIEDGDASGAAFWLSRLDIYKQRIVQEEGNPNLFFRVWDREMMDFQPEDLIVQQDTTTKKIFDELFKEKPSFDKEQERKKEALAKQVSALAKNIILDVDTINIDSSGIIEVLLKPFPDSLNYKKIAALQLIFKRDSLERKIAVGFVTQNDTIYSAGIYNIDSSGVVQVPIDSLNITQDSIATFKGISIKRVLPEINETNPTFVDPKKIIPLKIEAVIPKETVKDQKPKVESKDSDQAMTTGFTIKSSQGIYAAMLSEKEIVDYARKSIEEINKLTVKEVSRILSGEDMSGYQDLSDTLSSFVILIEELFKRDYIGDMLFKIDDILKINQGDILFNFKTKEYYFYKGFMNGSFTDFGIENKYMFATLSPLEGGQFNFKSSTFTKKQLLGVTSDLRRLRVDTIKLDQAITTGEQILEVFKEYEGSIYYPAGEVDGVSIRMLAQAFPKVSEFLIADPLYAGETTTDFKNVDNVSAKGKGLQDYLDSIIESFKSSGSSKLSESFAKITGKIVSEKNKELEINIRFSDRNPEELKSRTIKIRYFIKPFEQMNEEFDMIFVKMPGWDGKLSKYPIFWKNIKRQISGKGRLIVSTHGTRHPPKNLFSFETDIRMQDIGKKRPVYVYSNIPSEKPDQPLDSAMTGRENKESWNSLDKQTRDAISALIKKTKDAPIISAGPVLFYSLKNNLLNLPNSNLSKDAWMIRLHERKSFVSRRAGFINSLPFKLKNKRKDAPDYKFIIEEMLENAFDAIVAVYDKKLNSSGIPKGYKGKISVGFYLEGDRFVIKIVDNGIGDMVSVEDFHQRKKEQPRDYMGRKGLGLYTATKNEDVDLELGNFLESRPTICRVSVPLNRLELQEKYDKSDLQFLLDLPLDSAMTATSQTFKEAENAREKMRSASENLDPLSEKVLDITEKYLNPQDAPDIFNDKTRSRYIDRVEFLSAKLGAGIEKKWILPKGLFDIDTQRFSLMAIHAKNNPDIKKTAEELAQKIIELNPELKEVLSALKYGDNRRWNEILFGVASRYNAEDITFYLKQTSISKRNYKLNYPPEITDNIREGFIKNGIDANFLGFQYRPSPETLERLQEYLNKQSDEAMTGEKPESVSRTVSLTEQLIQEAVFLNRAAFIKNNSTYLSPWQMQQKCDLATSDLVRKIKHLAQKGGLDIKIRLHSVQALFPESFIHGHGFLVVSAEGKDYLIDTSLIQFFNPKKDPGRSNIDYRIAMYSRERKNNWKDLAVKLLKNGYIELTDEVADMYATAFSNLDNRSFSKNMFLADSTEYPMRDEVLEEYMGRKIGEDPYYLSPDEVLDFSESAFRASSFGNREAEIQAKPNFTRLFDIIGFSGIGIDLKRKYINDISVAKHDIRTANTALKLALELKLDKPLDAQFIGLIHDYGTFSFRHIGRKTRLSGFLEKSGFNDKRHRVKLLQEDNIALSKKLIKDILNFDIAKAKQLSPAGKVAIAAESVVGVFEDIFFGLKYRIITFSQIPESLKEMLALNNVTEEGILMVLKESFDGFLVSSAEHVLSRKSPSLEEIVYRAKRIKEEGRKFIIPNIFQNNNIDYINEVQQADHLIMSVFNKLLNQKESPSREEILKALDSFSRLTETDIIKGEVDKALLSKADLNDSVGGIDFNPQNLEIEKQGGGIDFGDFYDLNDLEKLDIQGLTPVILNVIPIAPAQIPMLLGLADNFRLSS